MKLFLSLALFAAFLLCPTACADGVREGLSLAAVQALPALFPFFVVSGLLVRCDTARLSPLLAKPLARLYGLPPEAAPALVLGLIGGWKDSKEIRKQSVLVVDKDGLKLYTLSGKENQPDIQSEMVDLKTSDKIKLNTKLPEYEYTGKDLRIKAVFDETKKRSDEDKEEGLVTIPMLNIYKIVETKSGAEVYANFWSETYYRYGSLLKNYSGGSYPGVMYLKKTKDGYRVTKTRYAEDGESLERSIWKLCKGYPDVAIRMMKDSATQNQRKKVLQKYVSQNKLKIKAYKEYGWQYVNL